MALLKKLLTSATQPLEDVLDIIEGASAGIICAMDIDGIYINHNQITDLHINKYELPYNNLLGKSILDMTPKRDSTYCSTLFKLCKKMYRCRSSFCRKSFPINNR